MKTSGACETAAVEDTAEGRETQIKRRLQSLFPSRASIFQIDNDVGLGDQPGDFHLKRCFPSEITDCYDSLTLFFLFVGFVFPPAF